MEQRFLSLLYPSEAHSRDHAAPRISEATCDELGFFSLFSLRNSAISDYFTTDPEVIRYRQETLADLERIPALGDVLSEALPILCDIEELRLLDAESTASGESYLYSITEIELYISCVEALKRGLLPVRGELQSAAFRTLADIVFTLTESDYYRELNTELASLSKRIHEVKSVTVGVNLDAQLRPSSAGVISINAESFKSGKVLDKILRMSFRNDSFTCIADVVPFGKDQSENRKEALQSAFHSAIDQVFRSSVRSWRAIVGEYVLDNTDFLLRILPEIEFVTRAAALTRALREKGYPMTPPTICPAEQRVFRAKGLYNPAVALRIEDEVVANDLAFDDNGRIFVLTGPNRGGKSVITCALGLCQAMAQLGMCVPAAAAEISPADGIFTHFPSGAEDTLDKGRLGEECARLREILEAVTDKSMILLDESLSSTGAYEATFIASELIASFALLGVRGIFSTHLHDLAASVDEINGKALPSGGVAVDNLVAGMEEGRRSFLILRQKPDGKSYAADIASRYGLSFEEVRRAQADKNR